MSRHDALTILVIDDEPQIRRVVRNAFESGSSRVVEAASGREGMDAAAAELPDLVILDLGLPDGAGLEVCREIRRWSNAPILVLSARHSDAEKVSLLDAGADDYVTKPFSTSELQARARALLRRARHDAKPAGGRITIGGLMLDTSAHMVTLDGRALHLSPIEWDLLRTFMSHPGRTLTHQFLFTQVWSGRQFGDAQQYLRTYVAHLRRKLESDSLHPRYIITEPGVGYRFAEPGEPAAP